ncbi:MAG TPA: hypothetical protein VKG86_09875 [Terracidiphilus sp.]|nr:hypothetical protein [Terracidiphilus sp.]
MDEEKDTGHPQNKTPDGTPPIQPPVQPLPPPPKPPHKDRHSGEKISTSDKIMAAATVVIAVGTLVSAAAIVLQWREMVGGGTQTDQIINAANGIKTAQGQLVSDNKQVLADNRQALAEVLQENREELANALQQNRDALQSQTAASNGQLAAIQQQTEVSERPWIAVYGAAMVGPITISSAGEVSTVIHLAARNIGKTPARETNISLDFANSVVEIKSLQELCKRKWYVSPRWGGHGGILFPDEELDKDFNHAMNGVTKLTTVESNDNRGSSPAITRREEFLFPQSIIGCIQYKSISSETPYFTGFVYRLIPRNIDLHDIPFSVRFDPKTGDAITYPPSYPPSSLHGQGSISIPEDWYKLVRSPFSGSDVLQ